MLILNGIDDQHRRQVKQVAEEFVRMLRLYVVAAENLGGKVAKIVRNDHIGMTDDRGGKNVAAVRVRQLKTVNEGPIAVTRLSSACWSIASRMPSSFSRVRSGRSPYTDLIHSSCTSGDHRA